MYPYHSKLASPNKILSKELLTLEQPVGFKTPSTIPSLSVLGECVIYCSGCHDVLEYRLANTEYYGTLNGRHKCERVPFSFRSQRPHNLQ